MKYQTNKLRKILVAAAAIGAASAGAYVYANRTVLTCDEYTIKEYQDLLGRVANNKYQAAMEAERTGGTLSAGWMWVNEQNQSLYDRVRQSLIDCGATGNMLIPTYFPPEF